MTEEAKKTLAEMACAYLEHLAASGTKESTLNSYCRDFGQIGEFFGKDRKLDAIKPMDIGRFLKSDVLLKLPNGKDRAKPTVDKTVRVLRMSLAWAVSEGLLATSPFPGKKDAK